MANESLPLFVLPEASQGAKKKLTSTQAAYLAGLLDGEGHFGMRWGTPVVKNGHCYKRFEYFVALVMTNKAFMEKIAVMVPWGSGTIWNANRTLKGRARPAYKMKWSGTAAAELCRAMLPYLHLKRPHAELILKLADAKVAAQAERTRTAHAYPARIVQLEEVLFLAMRVLNKRGQDNAASLT